MAFGLFKPELAFNRVYTATPEKLLELGVKGVVFDIDNTIAPYEVERPDEKMKNYFKSLADAGIQAAFVSNNKGDRVQIFNEELGLFYVCKAKKPFPKGVKICIERFGLKREEVIAIGDQIFTDCLAAHKAGIRFIMVKPIQPRENWFFRFKRVCEKPFTRKLNWV